jgi:hypothetical protein
MNRNKFAAVTLAVTAQLICTMYSQPALAQQESSEPAQKVEQGGDEAALAKAAQNPIANMISLPFQNNTDFGLGPDDGTKNTLNIQPVYPVELNDNWNLITRTIFPVVSVPASTPDGDRTNGLADTTFTGFFSPSAASKLTWGVGPVFLLPTATDEDLGGNWGAGASVVLLAMPGNWVIGSLFSNLWSTGGWSDTDVNLFTWQYFINYNMKKGWYLTTAPINTSNWEADDAGDRWNVPLGGGFGKIFKVGKQPFNAQISAYKNVVKPEFGADWQLRLQLQLLFPKG